VVSAREFESQPTIVEGGNVVVLPLLIAAIEELPSLGIQRANGFRQIAEVGRLIQVQRLVGVVGEDPGEDGILVEVVEAAPGDRVQEHEVVEVADLAPLPLVRHVAALID